MVGFDFDEDGDNDFMLTYGDNVRVYRQEAVNSFLATILGSTLGNYNEVQLTDYDQDGSIEFVYSTENSDDMFFTVRQGGFTFPTNSRVESFNRVGDAIAAFVVDDVDGNGALDVVVGIRNSRELIIENQSFGFVNPATVTYAEDRVTSLIAATVSSTGQLTFTRSGGYAPGLYNFQITNITDGNGDAGMVNFRSSFYVNDPDTEIDLLDANLAPLNTNAPPSVNSGTNFGTIPANSTSSTTFIIQNIGNKELFFKDDPILSFSSNAVFSLSPNSNTPPFINPSDAAAFTIDCQPTTQGVHSAIAYLRTNDCSEPIYRINLRVEASAPLAIDLAHFTAAAQQENILLHWQTNNEQIAEGFEVEWSLTGEDWKKIGFVEAQQQAAQYNFIHETPSTGANYYRLALLSNDFAPEYSDIQSVEMSDLQIKNECTFYPNPVSDQLFVDLGGQFDSEKEVEMSVLRSDGTIVQRGQVINWQPIDLQTLASGIYFIELQQEEVKVRERIVKR
ncbi:MAG: FG-GAP-like repeat-containing protein [Saprospiraceae bacterium]